MDMRGAIVYHRQSLSLNCRREAVSVPPLGGGGVSFSRAANMCKRMHQTPSQCTAVP